MSHKRNDPHCHRLRELKKKHARLHGPFPEREEVVVLGFWARLWRWIKPLFK